METHHLNQFNFFFRNLFRHKTASYDNTVHFLPGYINEIYIAHKSSSSFSVVTFEVLQVFGGILDQSFIKHSPTIMTSSSVKLATPFHQTSSGAKVLYLLKLFLSKNLQEKPVASNDFALFGKNSNNNKYNLRNFDVFHQYVIYLLNRNLNVTHRTEPEVKRLLQPDSL